MGDWELVTTGCTDTVVRRSPDGRTYTKTATTPSTLAELVDERNRLGWLRFAGVKAPRVLDWEDGTLTTSALPGVPASELPAADAPAAALRLADYLESLHQLPVEECPFDRRLAITMFLAEANVAAGSVDEEDFDEVHLGQSAEELLARLQDEFARVEPSEAGDLAVCHGDFCLPNVYLDPSTLAVTGILDVGRLGVADRHRDLALLTRSVEDTELNPAYGPALANELIVRTGADPWRIDFYRLLDEFF